MKRLMIGHHGFFDEKKQQRDFREDFFGVEACLMKESSSIGKLMALIKYGNVDFGVHFPLRADGWRLRDPQYLSKNEMVLKDTYAYMEKELAFISTLKPYYVLMHYPKPVILSRSADWTNWRFADDTEYYFEEDYTFTEFCEKSEAFFVYFSDIGKKYNFIPVLEFDALNKYVYETDFLEKQLKKHPRIRVCLDIGRLHLQDRIDPCFDSFDITRRFAQFAEVIHLWNVRVDTNVENSHYPALSELNPADGWADVEKYLSIIGNYNQHCKILFEHRSDLISEESLESCYRWIRKQLNNHSSIQN